MKRSEMIQKMTESLIREFLTCSEVSRRHCKDAAERMLDLVEDLEMLPPQTVEKSVMPGIEDFKVNKWDRE